MEYSRSNPLYKDIPVRFEYHKPDPEQVEDIEILREALWTVAYTVARRAPECREQELAVTKLEEALYWAIAAIVRRSTLVEEVTE
jgi:hypothetical protein